MWPTLGKCLQEVLPVHDVLGLYEGVIGGGVTAEEGEVGNACRQKGDNSTVHYRGDEHVYMYMYNVNLSDDNDCLFTCTGSKNLLPKP